MSPNETKAYAFFRQHGTQAKYALEYARAESRAEREGIEITWEDDPDPDLSWADEKTLKQIQHRGGVYGCIAKLDDKTLDSLWGISILGSFRPWSDPYLRDCQAQVLLSALQALDAERNRPRCPTCNQKLPTKG